MTYIGKESRFNLCGILSLLFGQTQLALHDFQFSNFLSSINNPLATIKIIVLEGKPLLALLGKKTSYTLLRNPRLDQLLFILFPN